MKFRVNAVEYQMHIERENSYEYFEKSFWNFGGSGHLHKPDSLRRHAGGNEQQHKHHYK